MKSNPATFYWDSSTFIMVIAGQTAWGQDTLDAAVQVLHRMEGGGAVILSSQILVAEVLPSKNPPDAFERFEAYLQRRNLHLRGVDHPVAKKAAEIRDICIQKGIRCLVPDALHVATALLYRDQIEEIHCVDDDFERILKTIGETGLRVTKPTLPPPPEPPAQLSLEGVTQGALFEAEDQAARPQRPQQSEEFDRFRDLVKQVVSVPKEEFDREAERLKEEAPPVKRGRKKRASSGISILLRCRLLLALVLRQVYYYLYTPLRSPRQFRHARYFFPSG